MRTTAAHPLGPTRIAALVLVALAAAALAYLRFSSDDGRLAVPSGAKAGQLTLEPCRYETEDGRYAADCGTLVVPENRLDPGSRLIALPVTRIKALAGTPAAPIFRLEGGPGKTNMQFANASRFAARRDVVLVGYRGVDGSSVLDCPEVESALKRSADMLGDASVRAYSSAFRSCATRLQRDGVDLGGYTLAQRVDDLEAARVALGYGRIDLVSESAGTRTAMIYAWRHPAAIHRSVMVGANPPGHFLGDPRATDAQIRRYAALCAQDEDCRFRTADLAASLRRTAAHVPDRWGPFRIKEGNVRLAALFGLVEATSEAGPLASPMTIDGWLSAAKGDASGLWLESLLADVVFPKAFVWGDVAAASRADARAADVAFARGGEDTSILGDPGTRLLWGGGGLLDAWPAAPGEDEYARVRTSRVETLVVGGALDMATPPQVATEELMPHLPNGRQVVLPNLGHTTDFWSYQPAASTHLITAFLDSGSVDQSLYTARKMDFGTPVEQTLLAKGLAGGMLGVALLTVLSLLWWLPRGVHRRGGYGRTTSAALRSLYAAVLGLGGWCLGVLLVLTTMPTVPVDDEVLAVLSIGVPVGLGIFVAWLRRGRSLGSQTAGLLAAVAGALVGGWLGYGAAADLVAVFTTIAGAALGANLAVLGLDIRRDLGARAPVELTEPVERSSAPPPAPRPA